MVDKTFDGLYKKLNSISLSTRIPIPFGIHCSAAERRFAKGERGDDLRPETSKLLDELYSHFKT